MCVCIVAVVNRNIFIYFFIIYFCICELTFEIQGIEHCTYHDTSIIMDIFKVYLYLTPGCPHHILIKTC